MTINYWEQILENRKKRDYIKWILCDKYIAKQFAETIGFKIPKTYQLTNKPTNIKFNIKQYVVKPTDLCDGYGVFLMNNNVNMIDNKHTKPPTIIKINEAPPSCALLALSLSSRSDENSLSI